MNKCNEIVDKFSAFLDDELTETEKTDFIDHIDKCKKCSDELMEMESLLETISSIEQVPLPENFHETFMKKLMLEEGIEINTKDTLIELPMVEKPTKIKQKKSHILKYNKTVYIAASFILILFIAITSLEFLGVNISSKIDNNQSPIVMQDPLNFESAGNNLNDENNLPIAGAYGDIIQQSPMSTNDSIMYYNISIEVEDINVALSKINALSGYNTNLNFNNYKETKNANIDRIIDLAQYNNTLDILKSMGKVLNESERVEKISYNLKELNSRLYAKKIEKTRLSSLIKDSKSVSIIFNIDNRVSAINEEINILNNMILNYEKLSKNPNLSITLSEKSDLFDVSNKTLKEKTVNAFISSINITTNTIQKLIIFLASVFIPFIILISFVYVLFVLVTKWKKMIKSMFVIFMLLLVGCSSSGYNTTNQTESNTTSFDMAVAPMAPESEVAEKYDETGVNSSTVILEAQKRKVILNGNLKIETTAFDNDVALINTFVNDNGGYIENSNLYVSKFDGMDYKNKNIVIKVPVENYENLKIQLQAIGKVIQQSENEQDITGQYYDLQSNLDFKLQEEKRLEELSASAVEIEDVIAIEEKLSEVKSTIELYRTQLKNFDIQVQYSTITVELNEVSNEQININLDNFGGKVINALKKSINYTIKLFEIVIVFISFMFIPFVVLSIFLIIIFSIVKIFKSKNLNKPKIKK